MVEDVKGSTINHLGGGGVWWKRKKIGFCTDPPKMGMFGGSQKKIRLQKSAACLHMINGWSLSDREMNRKPTFRLHMWRAKAQSMDKVIFAQTPILIICHATLFLWSPKYVAPNNIVACHLSKGSYFRWREDMSGGLTNNHSHKCHGVSIRVANPDRWRTQPGLLYSHSTLLNQQWGWAVTIYF